jgi:arabinofuranosyltransferase
VRATVRTVAAIVRGYRNERPRPLTVVVLRALVGLAVTGRRVPRGRRGRAWELAVPVVVLAIAGWRRRWVTEDAFINFRIVAVTRHGRQPLAFNSGERVEAGTSPLWLAKLVVLDAALGRFVALERLAVGAGLGLSVLGLAAATAASARLIRVLGPSRPWPAGALLLSVLPPLWDFTTSGMETGLTFGWLGGCQWLLARRHADALGAGSPLVSPAGKWLPVVLGLGPLIRPDLTLFSAAFLTSQLSLSRSGLLGSARTIGAALALPAAYQLFRMAYFAATVPNTALVKEAGRSNWCKGLAYLDNYATPYRLAVPGVLVAGWAGRWLAASASADRRRLAVLLGAPAAAAILHAGYVVRVGGDFMHGRLLLPATFGLFMTAAALPAGVVSRAIPAALAAWATVCALRLRLPHRPLNRWSDIVDERAWWRRESGHPRPITVDDYGRVHSARTGRRARQLAQQGADVLVRIDDQEHPLAPGSGVVLESITIGMGSVAAGPDVHVVDVLGLADAVGSRIPADPAARIGHQKRLPPALVLARVALADEDDASLPADVDPATLEAARRLLRRPAVARLLAATRDPLTPTRALRNIREAIALTRLRVGIDTVSRDTTHSSAVQDPGVPTAMASTGAHAAALGITGPAAGSGETGAGRKDAAGPTEQPDSDSKAC